MPLSVVGMKGGAAVTSLTGSLPHPAMHHAKLAAIRFVPVTGRAWRKDAERCNHTVGLVRKAREQVIEKSLQRFERRRHGKGRTMKTLALPAAVLEDLQWLQRLAAFMARDADEADDLVQDTLVKAWQDPPADASRSLRPWLGTVLRNRLRMRRRGELRREAREQQAPAVGSEPQGPDREHERLEVLRVLLAELQGLPAEDRKLIVRRFFEGESAADIGRALDIPSATIRSRIHRSLERLRGSLDQQFGDRKTWCAAVVAMPPAGGTASHASRAGSSSTMSITMKALLVATLGGTTGIVGWAVMGADADAPAAVVGEAPTADAAPAKAAEAEPAAVDSKPRRDDPRAQWQQRVRSVRSSLPPASGAAAGQAEPTTAPSSEDARRDAAHREFRKLVTACLEDLDAKSVGSVTLSVHELGAPDVGTIYESVELVDQSFDDPEVLECLVQSMYTYVGEPPAEAYARVSVWTVPLGKPVTDDEKDAQAFGYIVGAHMGEVRFCESKAEGEVAGSVEIVITIGESGAPESSVAEPSTLPAAVVECIVGATKRWKFPTRMAGKRFERAFTLPVPGTPAGASPG